MHEASVAKYVLDILNETISSDDSLKNKIVKKITFALSSPYTVYPDSFEFYFVELVKGTIFENCTFEYKHSDEIGFFVSSIDFED